ncbi:MAG: flagellar filament capping protein FliD, partial [Gemmatimonadaceae bacterium]
YVSSYNAVVDFIKTQQTPGADPSSNPTLFNDPLLRNARSALSHMMLTPVAGAASDMSTPDTVGISLTADGHIAFDANKFQGAFTSRYSDVTKLFMESGVASDPSVIYTGSTSSTLPGTYAVNITQPATQAQQLGAAFGGSYSATGASDGLTVTDLASNSQAQVQLTTGMTTAQIVDALNASFSTAEARKLQSSLTLNDGAGAAATGTTLLTDLHATGGSSSGVQAGDTIGFNGTRSDGSSYVGTFSVSGTSTMADFVTSLQSTMGAGATVSLVNGQIAVQSSSTGTSPLALTLTPNNQGLGQLDFGAMNVAAAGHGILSLTATAVGNQVQVQSNGYGAAAGISIASSGTGDAAGQLGIATAGVHGNDVAGTIGGYAATGSARQLVGAAGTPVDGLSVAYMGSTAGATGTMSLTQGMGSAVDRLLQAWVQTGGSVDAQSQQLNDTISTQQARLADFTARMALQRAALLKQYSAMDSLVSQIRAQGNSFLAAFSNTNGSSTSGSSSGTG